MRVGSISNETIVMMREMRAEGMRVTDVARWAGVSQATASQIVTGCTYNDAGGPITVKQRRAPIENPLAVCDKCIKLRPCHTLCKRDEHDQPAYDDNGRRIREKICDACLVAPPTSEYIEDERRREADIRSNGYYGESADTQEM